MEELATAVAEELLEQRLRRPERPLGLATGRTMEPVYRALSRLVEALAPDQRDNLRCRWLSFNLDEYVGPGPDEPGSFAAYMVKHLAVPLGLPRDRVLLPDGRAADPAAEARRYARALAEAGGIGLQLLGLGVNGHLGFNEPPSGPQAPCRVVRLCSTTRERNAADFPAAPSACGELAPGVPHQAITLGMKEILAAERLLLVVSGNAKAEVLRRALHEPPTPALPASWLRFHPGVTVYADAEALAGLEPPRRALAMLELAS
jgi:glucosamine-6-phosphate deaminase